MADETYPVTVAVRRGDGSVEQVRVGSATRNGEGFALQLGGLMIGGSPEARSSALSSTFSSPSSAAPGEPVFPPYGRSKGQPIHGATQQDLEFYANGSRRSLADPGKARWHEKERALLAQIEAEMTRQGFGSAEPPPPGDDDAPF